MKIALSADHAGYHMLTELAQELSAQGHAVVDFGPDRLNSKDDYPDYIFPAAKAVADGQCERGIVIGGDGEGEAMAANRIRGIRCVVFYGPVTPLGVVDASGRISHNPYEIIKLSRLHNDSNMLSLGSRFLTMVDMKNAIKLWLETEFSGDPRHIRRNLKLDRN